MPISVVIPTLNERAHLPQTITALQKCAQELATLHEIIIADGGSLDGTCEWVEAQKTLRLLRCVRGRGAQLNAGALQASGKVIFFLHADCTPSPRALNAIARATKNQRVVGGCFRIGFSNREANRSLQLLARVINFRSRAARTATGDQGIFARRESYQQIGGFQKWPLFEDVDFVTRLKSQGKFVVLPTTLTISARRWQTFGVTRTTLLMGALLMGYHLRVSPFRLKRWFSDLAPTLPKTDEN